MIFTGESGFTSLTGDEFFNYYYSHYDNGYSYYYEYEQNDDFVLCKWFDSGASSVEILFTSDASKVNTGVEMLAACVSTADQFTNRLSWSQRQLVTSGDCEHGKFRSISHGSKTHFSKNKNFKLFIITFHNNGH